MSCIISQLEHFAAEYLPLWREKADFFSNFSSSLASPECLSGDKTVNVPNSKRKVFYEFNCSQPNGRACVDCDNRAGCYYNQEARSA
jgi:hypothetical protein